MVADGGRLPHQLDLFILLDERQPVEHVGGVYDLRDKGFSSVPEFFGFSSWEEVVEYSETEYGQEEEAEAASSAETEA